MNKTANKTPVIGFAAYSGSGKTSLIKKLITIFNERGLRVGVIKQSHHEIEMDTPGKDSFELRKSGAAQTLLTSPARSFLITEYLQTTEPELPELICQLDDKQLDLILVEGFKQTAFSKIEVHRKSHGKTLLHPDDENIIAIATDDLQPNYPIKKLDLNKPLEIADYIEHFFL